MMVSKIFGLKKENKRLAKVAAELNTKLEVLRREKEKEREEREEITVLVESNRLLTEQIGDVQVKINGMMSEVVC